MKLSEFEEKLTALPEAKLREMLEKSRKEGPEIAVKLILAEATRRGRTDWAGSPGSARATAGIEQVTQDAPPAPAAGAMAGDPGVLAGEADAPPAMAPAWLAEETSGSKLHPLIKVGLFLAVLGGIVGIWAKYFHRG